MNGKRIMIAAPGSGSGKTVVTCALLWALKDAGRQVVSFKCGPDYIDPMFHKKVIGISSKNLDTFFTGEEQTRRLFFRHMAGSDAAVIEGVMGLFDGLGGIREEGSSYHLAKVTKTPILFVVDAKGMGRSVIPLIAGFLKYDREHLIRGVLLNRISKGYFEVLKPLLEKELKIPAVGFLPEKKELQFESRRLGLVMPDELKGIRKTLCAVSEEFVKTVSVEHIMEIAEDGGEYISSGKEGKEQGEITEEEGPVIAVAKDEAFCFYYEDNLLMLKEYGARLKYFSPLWDEKLPEDAHALLIGGGYPELYAKKLSENTKMRSSVREAAEKGIPIVAECGGFLYLHSALTDKEGIRYDMAGVIPAECYDTGRLVRFGYIEIRERQSSFLPEKETIRGHEFHYYDSTKNGNDAVAARPQAGREYSCIIVDERHWMGFPHLYYPSNPAFARLFVEKAKKYQKTQRWD